MNPTNRFNGNGNRLAPVLEEDATSGNIQAVCSTLLIGVGGTGADICRRFKALSPTGSRHLWSVLVFDTDPRSQEPDGDLPGFTSAEFCLLPCRPVRDVIRRPEYHAAITARLGLADTRIWQSLATVAERRIPGAGQVRPIGYLALAANYQLVRTRIRHAVDELKNRWTALAERLNAEDPLAVQFQHGLDVKILSSACGGTGSSCLIDIGVVLRQEQEDQDLFVTAVLTTPEVYEEKVQGKIEEGARLEANFVATATELDYFQTGQAATDGVRIGDPERKAPTQLFEHVHYVGKYDSEGRNLGGTADVFDTIALHMAGDVGTTVGGKFKAIEANDATVAGLAVCPITGRKRNYSTLSATALVISADRLARHLACRAACEILNRHFLGDDARAESIQDKVSEWMLASQLAEGSDFRDCISARLTSAAIASPDSISRSLYADPDPGRPVYLKNRAFVTALSKAQQRWKDSELPEIVRKLSEQVPSLAADYCLALNGKITELANSSGLRSAESFLTSLNAVLDVMSRQVSEQARQYAVHAADAAAGAEQIAATLMGFWKRFGRDAASQEETVRLFRTRLSADAEGAAKQQAAAIIASVKEECSRLASKFAGAIEDIEINAARLSAQAKKNGQSPQIHATTSNVAPGGEIDVVSSEFLEIFYEHNRPSTTELIRAADGNVPPASVLLDADCATELYHRLTASALTHFAEQLDKLTISQVLRFQLDQKGDVARLTLARFEEALQACRPLWRAEIGVAGAMFSDSLIVGIPEDFTDSAAGHLSEITRNIQANLNRDPRYQAQMDMVPTCDPHRIYVLRRSHGGLPIYLASWKKYRQSYDYWMRSAAHPIHLFSPSVVDNMPALAIRDTDSEGELTFALGSAYGAIARRGSWYYLNISKSDQSEVFEMPVNSNWDCVLFQGNKLRDELGSLEHLVTDGKLKFRGLRQADPSAKLGGQQGRPAALKEFMRMQKAAGLIREFHDLLCTTSGNVAVARDLERYVNEVTKNVKPSDELYSQIRHELVLLRREIETLRTVR